jgi:hypothetical protein
LKKKKRKEQTRRAQLGAGLSGFHCLSIACNRHPFQKLRFC